MFVTHLVLFPQNKKKIESYFSYGYLEDFFEGEWDIYQNAF